MTIVPALRSVHRPVLLKTLFALTCAIATRTNAHAQPRTSASQPAFQIADSSHAAPLYVSPEDLDVVRLSASAFASDIQQLSGTKPAILSSLPASGQQIILIGTIGHSAVIDRLRANGKLDTKTIDGKWESSITTAIDNPLPGIRRALVLAGSDRRGTAFAVFALSRRLGVSPWTWWADVPVPRRASVSVDPATVVAGEPSIPYRGIFLNDEDWGLRPWAAKKMDPTVDSAGGNGEPAKGNIGPHTYERIFELLLRLHANTLLPAMHPGSLPFNAIPENAKLADEWAIVMSSSHAEALLRNNVGEWDEKRDGPWNYQLNAPAMNAYWDKRLVENGKFENFYTIGLRGVHDSGLEAAGTPEVKARLVEDVMANQRKLLAERVNPDVTKIPQMIWVYKESLDLYRVGMKVPDDVTLGWTTTTTATSASFPMPPNKPVPVALASTTMSRTGAHRTTTSGSAPHRPLSSAKR